MNNLPFTFVKTIHEEKIERRLARQHRRTDGVTPQSALMPDPIGLLFHQIHNALDRGVARAIQAVFHPVLAANESGATNFTVEPQR